MENETDTTLRYPATAGKFFPGEPDALSQEAEACITKGRAGWRPEGSVPRAVISAHAGYAFSGWLSGTSWRATARGRPESVVVLSPSHRHAFDGIALPSQRGYAMPGFELRIDRGATNSLVMEELAKIEDAAHDQEHGIETQLAFLHRLHPEARIVPLVIGQSTPAQVAAVIDHLAARDGTPPLFILSSDLSHFLPLDKARDHDAETAKLIETAQTGRLTGAHACGAMAIKGFFASRYGQGCKVQRLAMANSADVTGDTNRTVGYGAWAAFGPADDMIVPQHRDVLLGVARKALISRAKKGKPPQIETSSFAPALHGFGASFVTLQQDERLRGCIGSLTAHQPLIADVVENTVKSGFQDPRFKPITAAEIPDLRIKIAVLSPSAPMTFGDEKSLLDQLVAGRDGLILSDGGKRGVFLPMVWESLPTADQFLTGLKVKAGLPKDHWSDTVEIRRFCAESFAETA
ncbi:AmmeMemoRadiSam system protein B [Roseovarius aestuariivivens]|uniref:AmmeMemoRadiSam system protein B n=1 Tax=Roseovarius aestuariivivens TaxID=1888910 RepID=UPI001080FF65|nr:AmmeMemoRadiSam system protein B [Roseovarius aestuariivivens]